MRTLVAGVVSLALSVCVGCGQHKKLERPASVHLAVLAVTPFNEYKSQLQPTFAIDEKTALRDVIPTSGLRSIAELDSLALSGSLKVAPTLPSGVTGVTADDPPATKAVTPMTAAPLTLEALAGMADKVALDPALRYQVAQSLIQHVRLLNTVVMDASVPAGYEAFVVQLQVGVIPRSHAERYDVHADIAFFASGNNGLRRLQSFMELRPMLRLMDPERFDRMAAQMNKQTRQFVEAYRPQTLDDEPVRFQVVPLLATDGIEAALSTAAAKEIRQLASELSLGFREVGAGGSVERISQRIDSALGRSFFSTYSVSRLSENSVRVRLGAVHDPMRGPVVVPRTHYVPVLLLVPPPYASRWKEGRGNDDEFLATCRSWLIEPTSGKTYVDPDLMEIAIEAAHELKQYLGDGFKVKQDSDLIVDLTTAMLENDMKAFAARLERYRTCKKADGLGYLAPDLAWLEFTALRGRTPFAGTRFRLPPPMKLGTIPGPCVIVDNGRNATVLLRGVPARLAGRLVVSIEGPSGRMVPSQKVEATGAGAVAVFPTLDPARFATSENPRRLKVEVVGSGETCELQAWYEKLPAPETPKPTNKGLLRREAEVIVAVNGTGAIGMWVALPDTVQPGTARLIVTGGDVAEFSGVLESTAKGLAVNANGRADMRLRNLVPGRSVVVTVVNAAGEQFDQITYPVEHPYLVVDQAGRVVGH